MFISAAYVESTKLNSNFEFRIWLPNVGRYRSLDIYSQVHGITYNDMFAKWILAELCCKLTTSSFQDAKNLHSFLF